MGFDVAASYDALNPDDADHRFYTALAADRGLLRVADLGCGTGALAVGLARAGHEVVGVDPAPEMLRVARERLGGGLVTWLCGRADALPTGWADLVTMSGHVAQVFTTDDAWAEALREIRRSLADGGVLAFETRDPAARAWERWTREHTLRVVDTDDGPVEFWHDTVEVALPLVTYATTALELRTGVSTTHLDTLAFRDEATLRADLAAAGFAVEDVVGDWDAHPVSDATAELIVIARVP